MQFLVGLEDINLELDKSLRENLDFLGKTEDAILAVDDIVLFRTCPLTICSKRKLDEEGKCRSCCKFYNLLTSKPSASGTAIIQTP